MMTLFPLDLGKPVIKYIETSSQHWLGMDKGCDRPGVLIVSTLFCWQRHASEGGALSKHEGRLRVT